MMQMVTPSVTSNSAMNSYVKGFDAPKQVKDVIKTVYGARIERRKLERNAQVLQKNLEGFKAFHEGFLDASKKYHQILGRIPYLELENTEQLSQQAVSTLQFRENALKKLNEKYKYPIIKEIISLIENLVIVNTNIYKDSATFISSHSPIGALERGYILISDLDDETLTLDINFKIDLATDDGEIRGELEELDIVVYENSVTEVTASVREYIKDIYDDLRNTKNSLLSSELKIQKEILTTFIIEN
ncbi:hypothetical protein [Fluviicola taffensis]|uniref:Uncharacterized protein n=1 Tax=Fluviicola taffensis (strain DSM 16823 / NCIMB 13979 / RW262) TaxID=755732 RepID=F2I9T9_FLUTR|nr:hypothetical protein [Fluviicola taffensis]AEA43085.1 hypothetical protein Fluta_1088 [Fluviicola taffensis DSM 16823]